MVEQAAPSSPTELIGDTKDAYQWDRALIETEFCSSSWSPSRRHRPRQNPEPRRVVQRTAAAASLPGEIDISKRSKPKSVP